MRTNFDFAPYRRSTVGFDRLFDLLETGSRADTPDSYPPFDILRDGEDSYRISIALAGFRPDDIEIVAQQNSLIVSATATWTRQKAHISIGALQRAHSNAASSWPILSKLATRPSKTVC